MPVKITSEEERRQFEKRRLRPKCGKERESDKGGRSRPSLPRDNTHATGRRTLRVAMLTDGPTCSTFL